MIKSALLVGLGGFLGSILRWALSVWMLQFTSLSFPWGTLGVNLGGSFLIGIFLALAARAAAFRLTGGCFWLQAFAEALLPSLPFQLKTYN
jgi:fluoride ion exporter CrcB/FEX